MAAGKIVVIGATGTLGTYLVDELASLRHDIVAAGRKNVKQEYYNRRSIGCATVDITRQSDFDGLPQSGVSAVVQIAGCMPATMAVYAPREYIDVNAKGTLNVLEYCRNAKVAKYLFMQSHSDVAGYWNTGKLIPADAPRSLVLSGDHAVYIISKCAAADLIEHYHQQYGMQAVVFRLPTIYNYGPTREIYVNGVKRPVAYRLMIEQAIRGDTLEVWGDPRISKDIVYVKDFTQMVIKALESDKAQGMYNVGSGEATTLEEQVRGIAEVFSPRDKPSRIVYCPDKPSQSSHLYDISKAVRDLGYSPRYSYIEMLEDMKREMEGHRFDHLLNAGASIG